MSVLQLSGENCIFVQHGRNYTKMRIIPHTSIEILADRFIEDIFNKESFAESHTKGGFLTGGKMLVCESKGLQGYLQQRCVDEHGGIWTALQFKPLAGLLMQCAYNLSKEHKKDEKDNVYNKNNLVWAIYNLLPEKEKKFSHASELASLFFAYQIYRPKLIQAWMEKKNYEIPNATGNFINNEIRQRKLWNELENKHGNENISQLYKSIEIALENPKYEKKFLPRQIFIFAPLSIAPIHLKTLTLLAKAGCEVNLYVHLISDKYIGDTKSDKSIAYLRKISWENKIVPDEDKLYWDLGNRLIANLGRSAQVLYEQIGWDELEPANEYRNTDYAGSLLEKIQTNIINDENEKEKCEKDDTVTLNSCFSPLREIEVLADYILDLFAKNEELTTADIAVVAPNIDVYASAIEMVFGRYEIPYKIADRNVKKYDKTAQLLNLLFSLIGSRYEAPDIVALFEYSRLVQNKELDSDSRERLEKWVRENAIRHGLEKSDNLPNYSFASGFDQLAAGFFMISGDGFSEKKEYCYPDIEGNSAYIFGDFACFVRTLEKFEEKSKKKHFINDWDNFFNDNLQVFFGKGISSSGEDNDNPYQKVKNAWDSLKNEMEIGFGNENVAVDFSILKSALAKKIESNAKNSYSISGKISFANIETLRAVPHKVICCIGMNGKEFPAHVPAKDISLIAAKPEPGDNDEANEQRLIFLETLLSAKKSLYISWVGQSEKTADELEPSSVVVMLLNNLEKQYELKKDKIVVKHPLQPFSRKYFEKGSNLSTYDNRWEKKPGDSKNIWEWRLEQSDEEENNLNFNDLYGILSDAPKYFLKNRCKIELPDEIDILDNLEPFAIEGSLDKWQLMQWVLEGNIEDKIKIEKLRGKLPAGNFADKIIGKIVRDAEDLGGRTKGENLQYLISPSSDRGKYRLKHWLFHLYLNLEKAQDTKIFLKNKTITLSEMPPETAKRILDNLLNLKRELETQMLPIFPNPAFDYYISDRSQAAEYAAEEGIFGNAYQKYGIAKYSPYAKKILCNAKSFEDFEEMGINMKEEFKIYSDRLFKDYEVKNEEKYD
jgi:exodeoxyribonuclease V gamma subunit